MLKHRASDPILEELRKELVSDMSSALARVRPRSIGASPEAVADANPFAHTRYKLASRLLRTNQPLIECPARELTSRDRIDGHALRQRLDASPFNFDELETSLTY